MGSIKVGPTGPKGSAAGIGVSVSGLGPSALTGTIGPSALTGPISGVRTMHAIRRLHWQAVSGIGPIGPSGGPTGAGITRLTVDTSLSVDTIRYEHASDRLRSVLLLPERKRQFGQIVLRGDRTAEFFVPSLGEKVLSLLTTPERLEEAIGDFEQGFRLLATRQGLPHAHRWYYWQVIKFAVRSIWPLISELLKLGG
jgi:hypothetical protein